MPSRTPALRRAIGRLAEPHVLFPAIAVLLLAVVWGTTWHVIEVERDGASRTAATSSLELAETYEAQAVRALREIDQALRFVKFTYEGNSGRVDLATLKEKGLLLPDLLFVVSIADSSGRIVASTRPAEVGRSADLDFFGIRRSGDGIAMSPPQLSAAKESKLNFSRRLSGPDGSFAGIVVVSVSADYFVSNYEHSRLGSQGLLGILGTDGIFRARRTGDATSYGDATNFAALTAPAADQPPRASLNGWDGVRRFTSTRPLFDFPVAVVVGLSEAEQMEPVLRREARYLWQALGGSALLIVLLGGLGLTSWRLARTRERAGRELQEEVAIRRQAEVALRLRNRAIESSVNAILITDLGKPGHPIEYVNPAFERITGYTPAEVVGRNSEFLLGTDLDQPAMKEIRMALRERREGHAVLRNYRKDGSLFWNELYIAPVRDDAGSVTHYVEVMNDVTEAKDYEGQLAHQANFDALTGLANRNLLQDRVRQAIAQAKREDGMVAAVFLDLDHFKRVNDTLGHTLGDELLRQVATRLQGCVRDSDTVARLGGDEFVLLLNRKDKAASLESDVTALMNRLLTDVSEPLTLGGREVSPACSIGVSLYPQDGQDADTLLKNADAAMYRAKELGRNRFQFFTADVHERIHRRMELESSLRLALEREEFELHYQPQVSLRDGAITGVEALVRWRHPERGLIPPAQFIGFAEETGLIIPLGAWVLHKACAQNKAWQDAGLPPMPIAVNMSARQCERDDVTAVVRSALESSGLEPKYLELEITESISMARPEQSVPLMERLKAIGVTLSIDDFGTGFSNLSYLRRFPVDRLKIDLSFVRDIATDPGSLAISEAIITMSHSLNMQVTAEGVETQGQLDLLGARKCDSIQGYFFSPPVTDEVLASLLREGRRLSYPPRGRIHDAPTMLM